MPCCTTYAKSLIAEGFTKPGKCKSIRPNCSILLVAFGNMPDLLPMIEPNKVSTRQKDSPSCFGNQASPTEQAHWVLDKLQCCATCFTTLQLCCKDHLKVTLVWFAAQFCVDQFNMHFGSGKCSSWFTIFPLSHCFSTQLELCARLPNIILNEELGKIS